jgi:hypothetical protein
MAHGGSLEEEEFASTKRAQQSGRIVAVAVEKAVDEQCRRSRDLLLSQCTVHVTADPVRRGRAGSVAVECGDVEAELGGIAEQVVVLERFLTVEQQLVHVPEAALQ